MSQKQTLQCVLPGSFSHSQFGQRQTDRVALNKNTLFVLGCAGLTTAVLPPGGTVFVPPDEVPVRVCGGGVIVAVPTGGGAMVPRIDPFGGASLFFLELLFELVTATMMRTVKKISRKTMIKDESII